MPSITKISLVERKAQSVSGYVNTGPILIDHKISRASHQRKPLSNLTELDARYARMSRRKLSNADVGTKNTATDHV